MGESFTVKHVIGEEVEQLMSENALHSSLTHPNVMSYMYTFYDEEERVLRCYGAHEQGSF